MINRIANKKYKAVLSLPNGRSLEDCRSAIKEIAGELRGLGRPRDKLSCSTTQNPDGSFEIVVTFRRRFGGPDVPDGFLVACENRIRARLNLPND